MTSPPPRLACVGIVLALALFLGGCAIPERMVFATDTELVFPEEIANLEFEEVLFPAADGTPLFGWYLPGKSDLPIILFCHGTATNLSRLLDNLENLQARGFTVFVFDYRGYGRSGGKPTEAGTYLDAHGALAYLERRGWPPWMTIYFGRSLGAAVALQLALDAPPAGLILESPFTSIIDLTCHRQPFFCPAIRLSVRDYYENDRKIKGLRTPLLIFQGENDRVVPQSMARALFAEAEGMKELVILPGAGHVDTWQVGGELYWDALTKFIWKVAPQPYPPSPLW